MEISEVAETVERLERALATRIIDQGHATRLAVIALLCGGHVLIEDIPGVGKTTLARSLAQALGMSFSRVQGTTDLMPSEITGVSIWNEQARSFEFHPGPLFTQVLLFDELNRTTPKTQSALLEAMEERQATVDGVARPLPEPFLVLATQNPIDYEGTFPLTEAQRDRFFLTLQMGYPSDAGEHRLMEDWLASERQIDQFHHRLALAPVLSAETYVALFEARTRVHLDVKILDYILALVHASREHPEVRLGLSPRAALTLAQAAQAHACCAGRDFAIPDDVKKMIGPVAAHRLILTSKADLSGRDASAILDEIVQRTAAPAWTAAALGQRAAASRPLLGVRRPS